MGCEEHAITVCLALSQANAYWRQPFEPVLNSRQLVEFVVLDVDADAGARSGRFMLADVQVPCSIKGCSCHALHDAAGVPECGVISW